MSLICSEFGKMCRYEHWNGMIVTIDPILETLDMFLKILDILVNYQNLMASELILHLLAS